MWDGLFFVHHSTSQCNTVVPLFKDPSREGPPLLRDHNLHAPMQFQYKLTSSERPLLLYDQRPPNSCKFKTTEA